MGRPIKPVDLYGGLMAISVPECGRNFQGSYVRMGKGFVTFVDQEQKLALRIQKNGATWFGQVHMSEAGYAASSKGLDDFNGDGVYQEGETKGKSPWGQYQNFWVIRN